MDPSPADPRASLAHASWRLRLQLQPPPDLVAAAVDALVAGLDGPLLAELAGADAQSWGQQYDLFLDVLDEQGLEYPDEQTAVWSLARHTATQIVDGTLDPADGARRIAHDLDGREVPAGDLHVFQLLAWSLDDDPPAPTDGVEDAIVAEAAALLARRGPRRGA